MGCFSWIDADGSQNIIEDEKAIILVPSEHKAAVEQFFGVEITGNGIEGKYDTYGRVVDENGKETDAYDVCFFLNVCLTTDEQFESIRAFGDRSSERNNPNHRKWSKDLIVMTRKNIWKADALREAYQNGTAKTIDELTEFLHGLKEQGGSNLRSIAVHIGCYDEDNAELPYPIKWTLDESRTYENSLFSMGDPNQGFWKCDCDDEEIKSLNYKRDEILKQIRSEREQEQEQEEEQELEMC